jgi:hypothetical protein
MIISSKYFLTTPNKFNLSKDGPKAGFSDRFLVVSLSSSIKMLWHYIEIGHGHFYIPSDSSFTVTL